MWLALRFVHWALDCRIAPQKESSDKKSSDALTVVVETRAQRQHVVAANRQALAAGIRQGMGLADARLRLSGLSACERDAALEEAAMVRLAGWAWHYSSQLHWAVMGRDIECTRLVMEIGASLRLFGGKNALIARIQSDLSGLGYRYRSGIGDTPQAALAFARARHRSRRSPTLAVLPLACLDLAPEVRSTLSASGIERVGDLLGLPPSTLERRFGASLLADIARLQGRQPHGLALYRLPGRYDTRHELNGSVEHTQGLVFILRRVFDELARFLRGADSMIQTLRLVLCHEREPETRILLRLSAPTQDSQHLERIALQRLDRTTLVAPVIGIELVSDRLRRTVHRQQELWHHKRGEGACLEWPAMLDRLRARLGHEAVYWLAAPDDHRPEYASARCDHPAADSLSGGQIDGQIDSQTDGRDPLPRPLWLLDTPTPVPEMHLGRLNWLSGPERIESGWWQSGQRRDYYRALDENGRLLWIFRSLDVENLPGPSRYYVHGLFG